MATSIRTVHATAAHKAGWWEIPFVDDDFDTVTSTRDRDDISRMATDAAALWLDVDPASIHVNVTIRP
jgi:hypothetical protein